MGIKELMKLLGGCDRCIEGYLYRFKDFRMGIKQLMKLIDEYAPEAYKAEEKDNYLGRTIAIDASMQLYAFMVQIRSSNGGGPAQQLTNEAGDVTSHINGFFFRTINLLKKGITPVFVFDGKPPEIKRQELAKRSEIKAKAKTDAEEAKERIKEADNEEAKAEAIADAEKAEKRNIKVTKQDNEDIQTLLKLMGLPIVVAPSEAEAQCVELVKKGKAFAVATEDMDALTFGAPIMLRKLTAAEGLKEKVLEIHLDRVLKDMNLTMEQFIDLCILCGCDYCPTIKGIGSKTAMKLIKEHGTLEKAVASLDKKKYQVPEAMLELLDDIRNTFKMPEVTDGSTYDLKRSPPDEEGLIKFMVEQKGFNEERIRNGIKNLIGSKDKVAQKRLDCFFKVKEGSSGGFKRKPADKKSKGAKRGRGRGRGGRR